MVPLWKYNLNFGRNKAANILQFTNAPRPRKRTIILCHKPYSTTFSHFLFVLGVWLGSDENRITNGVEWNEEDIAVNWRKGRAPRKAPNDVWLLKNPTSEPWSPCWEPEHLSALLGLPNHNIWMGKNLRNLLAHDVGLNLISYFWFAEMENTRFIWECSWQRDG